MSCRSRTLDQTTGPQGLLHNSYGRGACLQARHPARLQASRTCTNMPVVAKAVAHIMCLQARHPA
eukprot:scaffold37389_cov20-Tisochrysis_lutea.AAC.3